MINNLRFALDAFRVKNSDNMETIGKCWRRSVMVVTTAQLYSPKPEFRLCAGSYSACGVS